MKAGEIDAHKAQMAIKARMSTNIELFSFVFFQRTFDSMEFSSNIHFDVIILR